MPTQQMEIDQEHRGVVYEFGYDHWGMTAPDMRDFLRSKGISYNNQMSKHELCVAIEKHCTRHQRNWGPHLLDAASFDPATYRNKSKCRQFLSFHDIPYPNGARKDELAKLVRDHAPQLRAQILVEQGLRNLNLDDGPRSPTSTRASQMQNSIFLVGVTSHLPNLAPSALIRIVTQVLNSVLPLGHSTDSVSSHQSSSTSQPDAHY